MAKRLLILTCSARKHSGDDLMLAEDRYDGPLWQVLRSVRRDQPLLISDVDVYVLSAAFGLIPADQRIPLYDQMMTPERAEDLREETILALSGLVQKKGYEQCCFGLSQLYLRALRGWEETRPESLAVTVADGPMGEKLAQVKTWLLGEPTVPKAPPPDRLVASATAPGRATVAGVAIEGTREQVFEVARAGIRAAEDGIDRYRDWYVLVDGARVAPKWLVSKLTGRSTANFSAADARRGLLALGVDVERVTG